MFVVSVPKILQHRFGPGMGVQLFIDLADMAAHPFHADAEIVAISW